MERLENLAKMGKDFEAGIVDRVSGQITKAVDRFVEKPSRTRWFLLGAAVGVLGVIFLDPVNGAKRRQAVRQKAMDLGGTIKNFSQETWNDLQSASETRH